MPSPLTSTDRAVTTARMGVARMGITRMGAAFKDGEVVTSGATAGQYIWKDRAQPATAWTKRR